MKKVLPIIFILIFVLTGIASADAPFEITISLTAEDGSAYNTAVIVNSGDQIAIKLGETDVMLTVGEKQDGALNFGLDPALDHNDEKFGLATLAYFLHPENDAIEFTEPGKTSPVLSLSWVELTLPEPYAELIGRVTAVLQGTGEAGDDFSVIFSMLAGHESAENAGFYVVDLDKNDTPELLLGEYQPSMKAPVFYDLYTIKDGELVHVFDGWDRSRYYLCENGEIAHEGSNSAFNSFTSMSYYEDGVLRLIGSVIYDANANPNYTWFLSTSSETEVDADARPLEEADARYTLAMYPYKQVELDSFLK